MADIHWQCLRFDQLSIQSLYQLLQARSEVFVVEQACAYQDVDGKDFDALHLCAWRVDDKHTEPKTNDKTLLAYARLLAPNVSYPEASIGRVMTTSTGRKLKLGRKLMHKALEAMAQHYPNHPIKIGAQHYLLDFYASLGFTPVSEIYDEDGIDHIDMLYTPSNG
ncbi:GNAT family N-acetyltransferase [Simiduia aestuariiviva]|uniref:ElaA protein n=1 Tax=Simiduia aestuariiviva TaxID=1510459 RepID=A0A839UM63_9GAMM|nr:GNAT family N-acetyltransferase [Simiduia aestuariiviva]MBB3168942.1 ElaA protein [Simiduia aestuariiviva]